MKKMRKVAGMLMAATVAMAMPMSAMSATIEVDKAIAGEIYTAYKIFDYTGDVQDEADQANPVAYTMAKTNDWVSDVRSYKSGAVFDVTESKVNPDILVVKLKEGVTFDAADFAQYLKSKVTGKTGSPVTATTEGAIFTDLDKGYYFVNTTTGSLCSLVNTDSYQTLEEKNELPEGTKKIVSDGDAVADKITATIGSTIKYKITVTDKKGTDQEITVHDKMDVGLEFNKDSLEVWRNGVKLTSGYTYDEDATYTDTDNCTFEVVLGAELVKDLQENETVEIIYTATVGAGAIDAGATSKNTAKIDYSHNTIDIPDIPEVYTYKFGLVKTDKDKKVLSGAKFKLYADSAATTEIKVVKLADGTYRVAVEGETGVEIEAGVTEIKGLGNGTYYLVETEAPQNYNLLTEAVEVKIEDGDKVASFNEDGTYKEGGVQVINYTGTILPSTGGIGTTIFYAAGIVVMAGAVFFVVRSRKHD